MVHKIRASIHTRMSANYPNNAFHLFRRDAELTLKPCVWYILGNFLVSYSLYPWNLFFLLIIRKNKAFGLKCAFIISSHSQICISWPLKNADINHNTSFNYLKKQLHISVLVYGLTIKYQFNWDIDESKVIRNVQHFSKLYCLVC